jgi:hypothetical protein
MHGAQKHGKMLTGVVDVVGRVGDLWQTERGHAEAGKGCSWLKVTYQRQRR